MSDPTGPPPNNADDLFDLGAILAADEEPSGVQGFPSQPPPPAETAIRRIDIGPLKDAIDAEQRPKGSEVLSTKPPGAQIDDPSAAPSQGLPGGYPLGTRSSRPTELEFGQGGAQRPEARPAARGLSIYRADTPLATPAQIAEALRAAEPDERPTARPEDYTARDDEIAQAAREAEAALAEARRASDPAHKTPPRELPPWVNTLGGLAGDASPPEADQPTSPRVPMLLPPPPAAPAPDTPAAATPQPVPVKTSRLLDVTCFLLAWGLVWLSRQPRRRLVAGLALLATVITIVVLIIQGILDWYWY